MGFICSYFRGFLSYDNQINDFAPMDARFQCSSPLEKIKFFALAIFRISNASLLVRKRTVGEIRLDQSKSLKFIIIKTSLYLF